jgi:glycosyltransferase involved in cell wall biosynthesis
MFVKPNYVADLGVGDHRGGFCLFAGRLSSEKGIDLLIDAWRRLNGRIRLVIVGAGPMEALVREPHVGVEYLGPKSRDEVVSLMREATLAIVPSVCYENFPMAIVESFSVGLPVVSARLGAMEEILDGEESGWLVNASDPDDLARVVEQAWRSPEAMRRKGRSARTDYENKFSPDINYQQLSAIYRNATAEARNAGRAYRTAT